MSNYSTTSYYPFDSFAPSIFSDTQTSNYLIAAFLGLLLYDHVLTLDKEVDWIWTLRWRLPKVIFLVNRYVITFLLLLAYIPYLIFPVSISFCNFNFPLTLCVPLLNFGTVELLLIIRVSSLYGHRKSIIWALGGVFVLALTGAIVTQAMYGHMWQQFLFYKYLPGCWVTTYDLHKFYQWPMWAAFLFVEGVLMLLTVYKLLSCRDQLNRVITVLARDSLAYFVIVFACMASIVVTDAKGSVVDSMIQIPTQCITSIAVGRMMMNIRGLILDDPENTLHLQTLQFAERTNSGSGIDEVVRS